MLLCDLVELEKPPLMSLLRSFHLRTSCFLQCRCLSKFPREYEFLQRWSNCAQSMCESEQNRFMRLRALCVRKNLQLCMESRLSELDLPWRSVWASMSAIWAFGSLIGLSFGWTFATRQKRAMWWLYITVEAKDLYLEEKLVEEMDEELCLRNMEKWIMLISHYGNAKHIGRICANLRQWGLRKFVCQVDLVVDEQLFLFYVTQ